MAVVDFTELVKHAVDRGYRLAAIGIPSLPVISASLRSASRLNAPLVFAVAGEDLDDGLLPSVEAMARKASAPVALIGWEISGTEQAVLAIRLGCNALLFADGLDGVQVTAIQEIAASCGIPVVNDLVKAGKLMDMTRSLAPDKMSLSFVKSASWRQFNETVEQAVEVIVSRNLEESGASGQGHDALAHCAAWNPVEHLIIYNTTTDEKAAQELAAEGRRTLDKIPGVRTTWSGCSVREDADYHWCWLIRFAHIAVIDSYREHPDHVRYADNHFRPVAGNRISIDYQLTGAD